jgi:XTP/dITP diphosphohydrolase
MKTIHFATTNKHKFEEVKQILSEFNIDVKQLEIEKIEPRGEMMETIAKNAAELIANKVKLPIILEDTGIFFEAYNNFPGPLPRYIFESIGYKGILKLLEKENKDAYFKTVAAYCEPGQEPVLFEGISKGKISEKVVNKDKDVMPYERIFIPENSNKTLSDMSRTEKNKISHRSKAFRKFGEWYEKKT